jgi:hypothetical protein
MTIDPLLKRWLVILYPLMILAVVLWRVIWPLGMVGVRFAPTHLFVLLIFMSPLVVGPIVNQVSGLMLFLRTKRIRRGRVWLTAKIAKKQTILDRVKLTLATVHGGEIEQGPLVITIANHRINGGTTPGYLVNLYVDEKEPTVFLVEPTGELAPSADYRAGPAREESLAGPESALHVPILGRHIEHVGWLARTFWC